MEIIKKILDIILAYFKSKENDHQELVAEKEEEIKQEEKIIATNSLSEEIKQETKKIKSKRKQKKPSDEDFFGDSK